MKLLVAPTAPSVATAKSAVLAAREAHPDAVRPGQGAQDGSSKSPRVDTEVVVIGTGAGGAAAGTELAVQGKKVLFVEAGRAWHAPDFQQRSMPLSLRRMFQGRGLQLALGSAPFPIPSGRGVGGSTLINSGICFRPPDFRLREYADILGDDRWGPDAMKPLVDEIWQRTGVMATHAGIGRQNNILFRKGIQKIGFEHDWMDRNAPGCLGCGICHLGCPSGGKASVDRSLLPEAINHGARILTSLHARSLILEGGRAKGVWCDVLDPETDAVVGELEIRADRVLVAGSALRSPLLLAEAGLGGPELGKHLAIHPGGGAFAEFDEPVHMWNGVPQGYWGRDAANPDVTFETANLGASEIHAVLGAPGMEGARRAMRYKHLAMAGGMLRDDGEGTVTGTGPSPAIDYSLTGHDVDRLKKSLVGLIRIFFTAGAKTVAPMVNPITFYASEEQAIAAVERVEGPTDFGRVYGSHPHGTCRMGPKDGPNRGVTDSSGKVWGAEELYVVDGSVFPTTLGVNPQISIMAFGLALARRMV